jgi:hypothetical protein
VPRLARLLPAALVGAAALAQTPPPAPPAPPPPPCASAEHRQFDFWLGEWEVTANGKLAGTNRITRLYGDCGLREEYSTPRGYVGSSFNLYDPARGVWHQTWVDNQGTLLLLDGGWKDGQMVLEGEKPAAGGARQRDRIRWTPNADGTVRQLWEVSTDGGQSWTVAFDGLYRKAAAKR